MTDRDDYPAAAAKAGRVPPAGLDPAPMVAAAVDVRAGQARPQRHRLRGRPALHRRPDRRAPPGRRRGPRAVPPLRGRRVPGRQPAAAGAARPVARRPRRGLRRRRPEPDDLLLRRRVARTSCSASGSGTRGAPRCGWSATTAPRRRWSALANRLVTAGAARAGAAPLELVAQRAGRPGARPARATPTSRPRPRHVADRGRRT